MIGSERNSKSYMNSTTSNKQGHH